MEPKATPEARIRRFMVSDEFYAELSPIGVNKARELIDNDPRAPKPILGSDNGRKIYSRSQVEVYLQQVEAEGFPHLHGEVAK